MVTVAEFIAYLQTQPQDLPVAHQMYSEQVLLDLTDIVVAELSVPRADGWIQHKRPDMATQLYLLLPGN